MSVTSRHRTLDTGHIGVLCHKEKVRRSLTPFIGSCDAVDWVVQRQSSSGAIVFNERNDRFQMKGRWADLAVHGVFAEFNEAMKG